MFYVFVQVAWYNLTCFTAKISYLARSLTVTSSYWHFVLVFGIAVEDELRTIGAVYFVGLVSRLVRKWRPSRSCSPSREWGPLPYRPPPRRPPPTRRDHFTRRRRRPSNRNLKCLANRKRSELVSPPTSLNTLPRAKRTLPDTNLITCMTTMQRNRGPPLTMHARESVPY